VRRKENPYFTDQTSHHLNPFMLHRRFLSILQYSALIVLVGGALLLSIARAWLPHIAAQRGAVAAWVSTAIGQPIEIERLSAEWRGFYPVLHLRGVRLLDPLRRHSLLRFDELRVTVDPYAALYRWRVQIHDLCAIGARLSIERRADGSLGVTGAEQSPDAAGRQSGLLAWLAVQPRVALLRSEIHWRDARSTAPPQVFSSIDLQLVNDDDHHQLAGATVLPQTLGRALRVVMDFRGDLANPAQWSGKIYVRGQALQLATWMQGHTAGGMSALVGQADAELWGDFANLQLHAVTGTLRLQQVRAAGAPGTLLDEVAGGLRWRFNGASWRLDVDDLRVVRNGAAWPKGGFSIRTTRHDGQTQIDAAFDFLRLQDVKAWVVRNSLLPATLHERLDALAPQGDVHDLRLVTQLQDQHVQSYYLKARLDALATRAWQRLPALRGLSGTLEANDSQGELQLDSRDLQVELPNWFRAPLLASSAQGTLAWYRFPDRWRIQADDLIVANADIKTETRFALDVPQDSPALLDLQSDFHDGDMRAVPRYIPAQIMSPKVVEWLDRAFVAGQVRAGTAFFHGRFSDFPFDRHDGLFQVNVAADNATLDYHAGWPRIEAITAQVDFDGRGMNIAARSGRIFSTPLGPTQVSIADLTHGELQLDGSAHGSNADLLRFVQESPLAGRFAEYLAGVTAQGNSTLHLSLTLPLAAPDTAPQVLGRVNFSSGALAMPSLDLALEDIHGPLDFTASGLVSTGIDARLLGDPVRITAQAGDGAASGSRLEVQGHVALATLAKRQPGPWWRFATGDSDYSVSLSFSAQKDVPATLHIEAPLHGVAIRLPAPLGKAKNDIRVFTFDTPLGRKGRALTLISYDTALHAALEFDRSAGKSTLTRGEVRFGATPAQLPDTPGLRIAGELAVFDVDAWRAAFNDPAATAATPTFSDEVTALDLRVQECRIENYALRGLHLWAERQPQGWLANVSSDKLTGRVQAPLHYPDGGPLIMDLEQLRLDAATGTSSKVNVEPQRLPALQINAKHFAYHGADFGTLTLLTSRNAAGLHVDKAEINAADVKATAVGDWRGSDGHQTSRFKIDVTAPELGALLGKFGYVGNIKGGATSAQIEAEWPGSPARFALERLQGTLHADIKNGRFVDIEPGAGRVFGLLSINELQRRLRLDFSDLFKKGFSFDDISGDFMLDRGNAFTNNTTIKGPAARIDIEGRTGLVRRDYQQLVTVTPHLTSSLPLAGAIANPGVGAALFLAQKLFENQLDAITRYRYRVYGSWDKPVFERVTPTLPGTDKPQ